MVNSHRWRHPAAVALLIVSLLCGGAAISLAMFRARPAEATASCVAHTNSQDELSFLSLEQAWRNAHISGSYGLTISGPLNAAAAGYAQYLANTLGAQGHNADGTTGYAWATRAVNCGYPQQYAAGGEGLAVVESSAQVSLSPQQALNVMTSEGGGGIWVPSDVGLPVKCVGIAKATSNDGKKVAWVTLLFATLGSCPSSTSPPPPSSTTTAASPSTTSSATATAKATPTATATPTRAIRFLPMVTVD
jgi:hypothetical protein